MAELTTDARQTLEAFLAIHTRGGGERQTHTDRAIKAQARLSSSRVSAALMELAAGGYISASMPLWEGTATLKSFRMNDKGRQAVSLR